MKKFLILLFVLPGLTQAQEYKATSSFTVSGKVKSPVTIRLSDFKKWKPVVIGDVVITNHLGEKKSEARGLKGVLVKDVLQSIQIDAESPKVLSEYFFVFKANDGYTIVYSWNELFNTSVGDSAYFVTEKEGKSMEAMSDSILMISAKDLATGRRHLKALSSIEVRRA